LELIATPLPKKRDEEVPKRNSARQQGIKSKRGLGGAQPPLVYRYMTCRECENPRGGGERKK